MKSYHRQVKIYVIIGIIVTFLLASFVAAWISDSAYLKVENIVRNLKSLSFKYQFQSFNLGINEAGDSDLMDENLDYGKSIPVIVYHGIPYSDVPNEFSITIDNFKDQMFALKKAGYNSITTDELYQYLRGEVTLPPKSILITFDDGRIDSFELADPVLKALDYKATMFVIGRYTLQNERQNYYLSANELKNMSQSGRWDIEAHSYDGHGSYLTAPGILNGHFFSHKQWLPDLGRLETDQEFRSRITDDLKKVKSGLETLIGKPVNSFAYPYGDYGQNNTNFKDAKTINIEATKDLYGLNFYQTDPIERFNSNYFLDDRAGQKSFYAVRLTVNSDWTGTDLLTALKKITAKKLPYTDNFSSNKGWLSFWGKFNISDNKLTLAADQNETGGTTILDGTRLWKDYSVKANVSSPNKSSVYVWARFQNDNNNIACNFDNGFIHIEQTLNGETRIIKGEINNKLKIPAGNFEVEVRVKDRDIQCIFNHDVVVESQFIDPALFDGGIGFKTWTKNPGVATLLVNSLSVNEI